MPKILVVDDEIGIRELLSEILRLLASPALAATATRMRARRRALTIRSDR